ncbi:hypothetical protein CBM2626_U40028 [Cupriavidus taiwanensis]|uniref:Uncharacterized protein n=1 Tax=Cupriavidus taiwanensis TaxID=164546 RepID=A0A375EE60_9BURK|nr:hypothetical protein CBM2614_U40029 [Cupriavidus taiwanensis]SOZ75363.1 hypothetical protein CBM2613_U30025 [Cupriavidus taiwanensis]SPA03890.1 hypothetical protein CBM2626_U40028 [Cupriavidus taiwanensis]SPA57676.1 hypothetical protein CBM2638_U20010 [Cupriavidus taiwanensis]
MGYCVTPTTVRARVSHRLRNGRPFQLSGIAPPSAGTSLAPPLRHWQFTLSPQPRHGKLLPIGYLCPLRGVSFGVKKEAHLGRAHTGILKLGWGQSLKPAYVTFAEITCRCLSDFYIYNHFNTYENRDKFSY